MTELIIAEMMQKRTIRLAVLSSVLVWMMAVILVPMLVEEANARTVGYAQAYRIFSDPAFTNVKWHLDAGKWIQTPIVTGNGRIMEWITAGSGFFGGLERGTIEADFGPGKHVIFKWTNPDRGENHCLLGWTGPVYTLPCEITQDTFARAKYIVSSSPIR